MSAKHDCLHARREQLIRQLNQIIDEQLAYVRSMNLSFCSAYEDDHFCWLVDKECQIQNQIDHLDTTITE